MPRRRAARICEAARREPPLRFHADPQVPDRRGTSNARRDVIVIVDEAHRSQYDTLAMNMRAALPNALFVAFTGTPLIAGEERTREVFGDYVSVYDFQQSVEDGATVPLFYENRTPELRLTNPSLNDELYEVIDDAELDDAERGAAPANSSASATTSSPATTGSTRSRATSSSTSSSAAFRARRWSSRSTRRPPSGSRQGGTGMGRGDRARPDRAAAVRT